MRLKMLESILSFVQAQEIGMFCLSSIFNEKDVEAILNTLTSTRHLSDMII